MNKESPHGNIEWRDPRNAKAGSQEVVMSDVSGRIASEVHEIWPGSARRKLCIKYGLIINLTKDEHDAAHSKLKMLDRLRCPIAARDKAVVQRYCIWILRHKYNNPRLDYHLCNRAILADPKTDERAYLETLWEGE